MYTLSVFLPIRWIASLNFSPVRIKLLEEGKIKPSLTAPFPGLDAARANQMLESRPGSGNIVLLAPGLINRQAWKK
jgi:hypothetical protein